MYYVGEKCPLILEIVHIYIINNNLLFFYETSNTQLFFIIYS